MEDGARVGVRSVWLSRCMLYRVLRYILLIGTSIHHTHMVAGESDSRIQTALVAKWPEPIDVKDGIFVPGRVEKWNRELTAALRTRGLLQSLRTRAPSIEELCDQFPNEDVDVVVELYDDIMAEQKRHLEPVADNLPSVVLYSSMTMSDQLRFNDLASDGAGDQLYAMVMELCVISCGRAQDRLQTKYVEVGLGGACDFTD